MHAHILTVYTPVKTCTLSGVNLHSSRAVLHREGTKRVAINTIQSTEKCT